MHDGLTLLYVGIAPSRATSKNTLRKRIKGHYANHASRSTLRRSLGCLLEDELGIQLRLNRSGRVTFGKEGEARLSEWMADNAFVVWMEHDEPWRLEPKIIQSVSLPLNIEHNGQHPFAPVLSALRKEARERAKELAGCGRIGGISMNEAIERAKAEEAAGRAWRAKEILRWEYPPNFL